VEEEISLREIIETLLKWKGLIAGITVIALVVSGVLSFFVLTPTYEARATLLINQVKPTEIDISDPVQAALQSLSANTMTLETYRQQLKNPYLLQQVIDQLPLDPEKYNVESLADRITVEVPEGANLMHILVSGQDPKEITAIANTLADAFVVFINTQSQQKMVESSNVLADQVSRQEQELDQAIKEYQSFLAQSPGVDELEQESDSKVVLLTSYKTRLVDLNIELDSKTQRLQDAQAQLAHTPEKLVTMKSISDDPFLQGLVQESSGLSIRELAQIQMASEEYNPLYLSLQDQVSALKLDVAQLNTERQSLQEAISATSAELETINLQLSEKKAQQELILTRLNEIKANYDLLSSKYEEAKIASTMDTGQALVSKIAPAMEPINPTGPRKALNLAISAVLGLMVGVFVAFFVEYWNNTGESKRNRVAAGSSAEGMPR